MNGGNIIIIGGTGFFGRAFAKYLLDKTDYQRICIYSRDEWKQAQMKMEIKDPDERMRYFIGDVRDYERLKIAMERIDVVVMAAALKRIETSHYNPIEVVKTNINGTVNAIQAAAYSCAEKFLFLSTDKAYAPVSTYGYSKALSEAIVLDSNNVYADRLKFSVTRYGNVAGSTGSVIPIWKIMKDMGADTVPVSDPEVTRFWMWESEAVDLVYKAIERMNGGEIFIPDLPAYRLGDLAEAMYMKMNIKGLGKYEKLHECMDHGICSDTARRMTVNELRENLDKLGFFKD